MIYLYSYFAVTAVVCVIWAFYLKSRWSDMDRFDRVVAASQIAFAASTATIIGLIHSWTGEGFSYFGSILQQVVVVISNGKGI